MYEESEVDSESLKEQERLELGERLASVYLQDARTFLATAQLEPPWLVPGAIPLGAITFITGRPGASKSWAAYELMRATVQEADWLGMGIPRGGLSPCAVLLNYDNPHAEVQRRFLRLGLQPENALYVHSFGIHNPPDPYPPVLQLPDAFEALYAIIYTKRPAVIVVDSLRQAQTGDENNSQEMALVLMQLKRFAALGSAIIVIHHTRRNDATMRGSTEIEASADGIALVESVGRGSSLVTWNKTRGWLPTEPSIIMNLVDEGDKTFVQPGPSLRRALSDGPLGKSELARRMGDMDPMKLKKIVEKAVELGVVEEISLESGLRALKLCT